jgi:NADH-quinone oxidoreductase subunit G
MLGSLIREYYAKPENSTGKRIVSVSIMPCTAKKGEILRPESHTNGVRDVDYSLTTSELLEMLKSAGITAEDIEPCAADAPFCGGSGGGALFGVSGGVTEAALRYLSPSLGFEDYSWTETSGVRGFGGIKRAEIEYGGGTVKIAVVSGLANAKELMEAVKSGRESYDIIEVMACPGGCIMGGGQPANYYEARRNREERGGALYRADSAAAQRASQENKLAEDVYRTVIQGRAHQLLHRSISQ